MSVTFVSCVTMGPYSLNDYCVKTLLLHQRILYMHPNKSGLDLNLSFAATAAQLFEI